MCKFTNTDAASQPSGKDMSHSTPHISTHRFTTWSTITSFDFIRFIRTRERRERGSESKAKEGGKNKKEKSTMTKTWNNLVSLTVVGDTCRLIASFHAATRATCGWWRRGRRAITTKYVVKNNNNEKKICALLKETAFCLNHQSWAFYDQTVQYPLCSVC